MDMETRLERQIRDDRRIDLQSLAAIDRLAPQGPVHYRQMLTSLSECHLDTFTPSTTVLVLCAARNNQLPDAAAHLKLIQQRVRQVLWLNPEPATRWDQCDSELASHRLVCTRVRKCSTRTQLEAAVDYMLTQWQHAV